METLSIIQRQSQGSWAISQPISEVLLNPRPRGFDTLAVVPSNVRAVESGLLFANGLLAHVAVVGPSGWGKSHLLEAVANHIACERGARSYALFVDTSGYGHVVRKDDCVGKEKARVTAIGAGYVTLEVTPEQGPSTVGAGPTQRKIELHPEELQIDEEPEPEGGDIAPTPTPTEPQPEGVKEGTTDAPKQP